MANQKDKLPKLCLREACMLLEGHLGVHNQYPISAWGFMSDKDKKKINKAGYATPRGGAKGAYQNHVYRNNKVIIPFEHLSKVDLSIYIDGYIIRLLPEQYFEKKYKPRSKFFKQKNIKVGENAFVLYRTHESFSKFPPLKKWEIRGLVKEGETHTRRGDGVEDSGHYVLRLSTISSSKEKNEGPPQGIFAPEYCTEGMNYLSQCVLAWLVIHTVKSPYTTQQADHLKAILQYNKLLDDKVWEFRGILRHGLSACPLCCKFIRYNELHEMLILEDEQALENAPAQIIGSTRSTIVNLFHLEPLYYGEIRHGPQTAAWGHAVCNTKLGQRRCYPLQELIDSGNKVGIVKSEGIETFGWISKDWEMIRSPRGAVWIRLCDEGAEELINLQKCTEDNK